MSERAPERPSLASLRSDLLQAAREAGSDRLPDELVRPNDRVWFYANGDYEIAALRRVVSEGHDTNRFVDYALNFGETASRGRFLVTLPPGRRTLQLWSTGEIEVLIAGEPVQVGADGIVVHPLTTTDVDAVISVLAEPGVPAALSTTAELGRSLDWRIIDAVGSPWPATGRMGGAVPPHEVGEPETVVELESVGGGLFAAPAPLLGTVVLTGVTGEPILAIGESVDEALADPMYGESRTTLEPAGENTLRSRHRLGFQFVRLIGGDAEHVMALASVRPAPRRGAFVTSDPQLNGIWSTSAFTLRLCMQTFLIDGIKRDRMPWIGDHALGVLSNAYAFADGELIRDTLTALGRPRHGYINGIADYSLWWVISQGLYQRYFDDRTYLAQEAAHIDAFVSDLAAHAAPDGVFRPADLPDAFAQSGPGSLFLDWGVSLRGDSDASAIQMLWFWALTSAAEVLAKASHPGAERWRDLAATLRHTLEARAWSSSGGHWREYLDVDGPPTAYPNFLAVLAGLHTPEGGSSAPLAETVAGSTAGTPFMRAFSLLSLGRLGERTRAVDEIRRLWGRMLDAGALTFWEEFGDTGSSPYEMYRRPFGKSLCHAWSAGPAAVLPQLVLGLEPSDDGWREFRLAPELGDLEWAGAVVPTPHGDISVVADRASIVVDVPHGTALRVGGERFEGPRTVELSGTLDVDSGDAAAEIPA